MLIAENRRKRENVAYEVPAWMIRSPAGSVIGKVSAAEEEDRTRQRIFHRFVVRVCAVAVPILVFFSLPALGVPPGGAFSFLAFILLAWPLFVFEYDEEREALQRAFSLARIALGEERSR